MPQTLDELLQRFHELQKELEDRFDESLQQGREEFQYQLRKGRVSFQKEIRDVHRTFRVELLPYFRDARLRHIASAPIIYSVIVPLMVLDVFVTLYQTICFRIYEIPLVKRADHIILDRHKLAYLNGIEKFNCLYCGYGNGLMSYIREIFARTEQYWCPIKHASQTFAMHERTQKFAEYGDAETYRAIQKKLRKDWE